MSTTTPVTLSALITSIQRGDVGALDRAFECVYDELMRLASVVRQHRAGATLNTTALVHEVYTKLHTQGSLTVHNRLHFMRIAARAMRQVLADAAERKKALKRGGGDAGITLNEEVHATPIEAEQFLVIHDAINRLEAFDPRQAQIIDCRFFAGLSIPETAKAMELSVATINREWQMARAWLARELHDPD